MNSIRIRPWFCLLCLISFSACERGADPTTRYYVATQEALAADDDGAARAALEKLAAVSDGELKRLSTLARDAADLIQRRTAFQSLSEQVISGDIPPRHSVVFCPMAADGKGASWLQKEGEIRNPYFGSAMPHCGIVREGKSN